MNPYERHNLQRLKDQGIDLSAFEDAIDTDLRSTTEQIAALMTRMLFDIHHGNLDKVKADLRQEAKLFQGLNLTQIVNDTYTSIQQERVQLQKTRWNDDAHRKFGEWFRNHRATGEKRTGIAPDQPGAIL